MLPLARLAPERFTGLFFFDFPYPGIGSRMGAPDSLIEIWYQYFKQMPMASALVGANRDTCKAYFGYFLRHWTWRKDAFNDASTSSRLLKKGKDRLLTRAAQKLTCVFATSYRAATVRERSPRRLFQHPARRTIF
jgi:hypothetical protein